MEHGAIYKRRRKMHFHTLVCKCVRKYSFVLICACLVVTWIVLVETDFEGLFDYDENWSVDYDEMSAYLLNDTVEYVQDDVTSPDDGGNWRNLTAEQISRLSGLGRRMFLQEDKDTAPGSNHHHTNKTFKILVWKNGPHIEKRLIYQYGKRKLDPFESCSVSNCELSYNDNLLATADAILFHLHRTQGPQSLPTGGSRPPTQRWVFLTDESPYNTFLDRGAHNTLRNYDGIFNWSMTYRMDSDVPVPYGRTLRLSATEQRRPLYEVDYAKRKTKTVAIMGSNCGGSNRRWSYYVTELKRHIRVDAYGRCGTLKCPGHFDTDCPLLDDYKFYLAFENSNCREYATEKLWWNAYAKESIPVVMGASRRDVAKLLPPGSYIHTDEFASPGDLARYLLYLDGNDAEYNRYFEWKREYVVVNEHGYFKTPNYHYCRLCEALNYNDASRKVYSRLEDFWSVKRDCTVPGKTDVDAMWDALYS